MQRLHEGAYYVRVPPTHIWLRFDKDNNEIVEPPQSSVPCPPRGGRIVF